MSTTLTVSGMACDGCEEAVVEALEGVPGVETASADHEAGTATVEGDADEGAMAAAIEDAGYDVE